VSRTLAYGVAFAKESEMMQFSKPTTLSCTGIAVRAPWLSFCMSIDDEYNSIKSVEGVADNDKKRSHHYLVNQVKAGFPHIFQFMKCSCAHSLQSQWITTGGHPQLPRSWKPSTSASEASFVF
jgi:hypothetical protein